ncbi:MAG: FliM/FliN family flagellar motor switch protein [Rhodomicrobium sp.]
MNPKKNESVGITEKLKEIAKLSLDRLPVLNSIFEDMAVTCVERFRDYCSPAFTAFVNQVASGDSWDLLEARADSVAVIFYCREWDARILLGLERRFVFAVIEAMFGGDGSELPFDGTRPFTALETRVGRLVCEFAAKALEASFGKVCEISLVYERTETALEFTTLGQNSLIMIEAKILFQVLDQGGVLFVLIPQNSMNPIRQKLERERKPLPSSYDPRWTSALTRRVSKAEVNLCAMIEGKNIELDDILRLEAGKMIELSGTDQNIILECEGDRLFRGRLGQSRGHFTVTVDAPLNEDLFLEILDGPLTET